ncbi:MAG: hypothetical protein H9533_18595 [Rhodobacteraceae bacterium]|nr:hypothetical protein [Paracoccaceae bacterium]
MSETPENHTVRLLQEMRKDMQDLRAEMNAGFENVNIRMDGIAHILTFLAGNLAHHEDRISAIEGKTKS